MAVIGKLVTLVTAKTKPFERGMKRVQSSLGSTIGKMAAFAGAAIGVGTSIANIRRQFASLDEIAKLNKAVNGSAENFQRLAFVVGQTTSASTATLSKSMQIMTRNIGDAKRGTGDAVSAFKLLGIDIDRLSEMQADQQFLVMAQSLSQVEDQALRASLAADLFGRGAADMLPLLSKNADEITRLASELDTLGGVASEGQLEDIQAANDAVDKMKKAFDSVFRTIAINLAPIIEKLANFIVDSFKVAGFVVRNWGTIIELQFNKALLAGAKFWNTLKTVFTTTIPLVIKTLSSQIDDLIAGLQSAGLALAALASGNYASAVTSAGIASKQTKQLRENIAQSIKDGFEAGANRPLTDFERSTQTVIDGLTGKLAEDWRATFAKASNAFGGDLDKIKDVAGGGVTGSISKDTGPNTAIFKGSAEAAALVAQRTRTPELDESKKQTGFLSTIADALTRTATATVETESGVSLDGVM